MLDGLVAVFSSSCKSESDGIEENILRNVEEGTRSTKSSSVRIHFSVTGYIRACSPSYKKKSLVQSGQYSVL